MFDVFYATGILEIRLESRSSQVFNSQLLILLARAILPRLNLRTTFLTPRKTASMRAVLCALFVKVNVNFGTLSAQKQPRLPLTAASVYG